MSGTRIPDNRGGNPALNPAGGHRAGKNEQAQSPAQIGPQLSAKERGVKSPAVIPGAGVSQKAASAGRVDIFGLTESSPQNQFSQKSADFTGQTLPAREVFRQIAVNLGLPRDVLSVTLLAFCRFFSLPANAALLGNLRRELLSSFASLPSEKNGEKAVFEAEALGAAAAFDKGVTLTPEALERYARFFVPPLPTGGDESADLSQGGENPGKGRRKNPSSRKEVPEAEALRGIAEDETPKDSFLDFLNTLPGKNGQRWLVFPFKINLRGIDFSVFIRLLKKDPFVFDPSGAIAAGEDESFIADIAGPKKVWRFFWEKKAGKTGLTMQVFPELSPGGLDALQKKAALFFVKTNGGVFDEILVRNSGEMPSWAEDLLARPLPSVNRKV